MKIDFRQRCHMCDGELKIVAGDATKIGMGFKNTFVCPIETPEKVYETNSRNGFFISVHFNCISLAFLNFI